MNLLLNRSGSLLHARARTLPLTLASHGGTVRVPVVVLGPLLAASAIGVGLRNVLGDVGLVAGAAALIGARLSWLPVLAYGSAVYLAAPDPGGAAALWAWLMQPGPQGASWAVACGLFVCGGALYVRCGARPEGPRD
ncbi:hypothetical protein [Streptomyces kanamyceticus]|uniref:hypothetical protein n=1 Tax=Streptomyces kanamyceticus TaxID=1967 RepID=UPI000AB1965B|nr:hypothetical protein [Streptomyces kanamyceticus]